jgi:WD40 repeat protein
VTLTDPDGLGVDAVAFDPDGKTLAVGDEDGITYLFNAASRRVIKRLDDPNDVVNIFAVAFSPDGATLATGDGDGTTYLWTRSWP